MQAPGCSLAFFELEARKDDSVEDLSCRPPTPGHARSHKTLRISDSSPNSSSWTGDIADLRASSNHVVSNVCGEDEECQASGAGGQANEPNEERNGTTTPAPAHTPDLESGCNSGQVTPATGFRTPDPLLGRPDPKLDRADILHATDASDGGGALYELGRRVSPHQTSPTPRLSPSTSRTPVATAREASTNLLQGVPPELGSLWKEFTFVLVCSFGQLLFAFLLGNVTVTQTRFVEALGIDKSQSPWLVGSYLLANGLSVTISGSLADLTSPKNLMVGAFVWLTVWDVAGAFSLSPNTKVLFFVVRAMQGLAVGVLVSASMSVLGRIYNPGLRKTRVFSGMAAASPFGFWLGCLQGGALSAHMAWIFGSTAVLCGICSVAAYISIPPLRPARDSATSDPPSMRNFDYPGATLAIAGCACLLFGLTQGSSANWTPYTYTLAIAGVAVLVVFYFVEGRVTRPLIPTRLWSTPGFTPLILSYFLGFGGYVGAWQYYAVQFFLNLKLVAPIKVALYFTPNAVFGVLATWIVSRTLHVFDGHVILVASMLAFALGPVFFLPQTPNTIYFALSMPGIGLASFGPDLSFAAASIFITSNVPRSYQGAAGSLLVTVQNLSAAVMTALADTIGVQVDGRGGDIGLQGLRAAWWFGFALAITAALVTAVFVRIPKSVEKEHTT